MCVSLNKLAYNTPERQLLCLHHCRDIQHAGTDVLVLINCAHFVFQVRILPGGPVPLNESSVAAAPSGSAAAASAPPGGGAVAAALSGGLCAAGWLLPGAVSPG